MSSPTTTTPSNDLPRRLAGLGLRSTAAGFDDLLARATKARWSAPMLLEEIVRLEAQDKARRSLERRLRRSRIGRLKPMADFDWNWPKKIDRDLIERALTLEFISEGRNLVLLGPNGIGKTMIAKNVAHAAALAGHSVLFRTAADLIDDLQCDSPELRRRKMLKYTRPQLLVIDEIGYLSFDDHAADLLYKILNPRYEAPRSTLVTTNVAFKEWNTVFPNATCIATLLDRLTHHADVSVVEGASYRLRESEQEAAARRGKRHPPRTAHPAEPLTRKATA